MTQRRARLRSYHLVVWSCLLLLVPAPGTVAGDWPQWRYDAARRSSSPENLPETLHLSWMLDLPTPRPAWPSTQTRLQFDQNYEPVVAGGLLFVGSMVADKVMAFDVETGELRWTFFTDGPVRFAPAAWRDRLFVASDDGYLYCLRQSDGELLWRFLGGPADRRVIGNQRLIGAWPVRGAPVIYDDVLYFGASIWPFLGVFIHALDCETGRVVWTNSGTGSQYLTQQHNSPAFAGVAPQGYFAATDKDLVVSGGRTVPAVFERGTGAYRHYNLASRKMGSKGGGGYSCILGDNYYLNSGAMYRMDDGKWLLNVDAPVFTEYSMIAADGKGGIVGYRPGFTEKEEKGKDGKTVKKIAVDQFWSAAIDEKIERIFVKSGTRMYARGEKGKILAVEFPQLDRGLRISWSSTIPDKALNMLTANGKLFVTTDLGRIYCFGERDGNVQLPQSVNVELVARGSEWRFLDGGDVPPDAWIQPDFDDASWKKGPARLGYGNDGEKTTISFGGDANKKALSYFFRHGFEVDAKRRYSDLEISLVADDGAVVFLNGKEVGRVNMPDGEIKADTKAPKGGEETKYHTLAIGTEHLRSGRNVIAVRVHQTNETSSDVGFDLEFRGKTFDRSPELEFPRDEFSALAGSMVRQSDVTAGYCLVVGASNGRVAEELAAQSDLNVILVDSDAQRLASLRRRWDERGAYGTRLSAIQVAPGLAGLASLPRYVANLLVIEDPTIVDPADPATLAALYRLLRPYDGALCVELPRERRRAFERAASELSLEDFDIRRSGQLTMLRRTAAPRGSADWTHQYGDASNRVTSDETLARAPLGLLWFGGTSHEGVLPRHGHGPTPHVAGGRCVIEGRHMLRATDIYTGRLLWERELRDVGIHYDYTSHEPGANSIGSNYVTLADSVYVVHGKGCLRLNPETGDTMSEFQLPTLPGETDPQPWGFIAVSGDYLIAGAKPVEHNTALYLESHANGIKAEHLPQALESIAHLKDFDAIPMESFREEPRELTEEQKKKREEARQKREAEWAKLKPEERKKKEEERNKKIEERRKKREEREKRDYFLANVNKLLELDDPFAKIGDERLGKVEEKKRGKVKELREKLGKYLAEVPGRRGTDHSALLLKREAFHLIYNLPNYSEPPPGKFGSRAFAGSRKIIVLDRFSGRALWEYTANHEIRHNTIAAGSGTLFFLDRMPDWRKSYARRRGLDPNENARLVALDLHSGAESWTDPEDVFGTFVGYSEEFDVVVQAGGHSRDRSKDEVGQGIIAYRGATGEQLWKSDLKYSGPCLLLGDRLVTQGHDQPGTFLELETGKEILWPHPLSGEPLKLQYTRKYGCNTAIGCPNLITFRSAAAGFYDMNSHSGTANLGGFRSGCTSNLIPAGGLLNAPDYTRTCTCAYQNQASLALIHEPDAELWAFNKYSYDGKPIRRLGLNFGAPGDRLHEGTMWLDYPSVGGESPNVPVERHFDKEVFRRFHSSRLSGDAPKWVGASVIEGSGGFSVRLIAPKNVSVPNEIEERPPLETTHGTFSARVPKRTIPQSDGKNVRSLQSEGGKFRATVAAHRALASESITVELWVRTNADVDYVDTREGGKDRQQGFVFDNRKLRVRYFVANDKGDDNEGEVKIEVGDDKKIKDGEWVHLAFTYDASSGVGRLFRNGEEVGSHDGPDGRRLWWDQVEPAMVVGHGANDHTFLDELRICDRALPRGQLLPVQETVVDSDRIIGYWRMESLPTENQLLGPPTTPYRVRLVFAEVEALEPGERVFDVILQDQVVLEDFDISREAGGCLRAIERNFEKIPVLDILSVELRSRSGAPPVLSGIEIVREDS